MTVEELIKELNKFPMEAQISPYEGEDIGITIVGVDEKYGFIYTKVDKETDLIETIEQL